MKNFSIGDGDKLLTCPDRYLADQESSGTVVIWDPEHSDIPIRVSVLTITPKDAKEYELARWHVIEKAQQKGEQPLIFGDKAVYRYRETAKEEGFFMHYSQVGMGNHHLIFSITVSADKEKTQDFETIKNDLDGVIESLVERKEGQQFDCCLQKSEQEAIDCAFQNLIGGEIGEGAWKCLQGHYNKALQSNSAEDAADNIGMAFGELIRREVPSFHWKMKIDEYGCGKSLDFGEAKISIFPVSMIKKRLERNEALDLHELSSGTIEAVEEMYRKYKRDDQGRPIA